MANKFINGIKSGIIIKILVIVLGVLILALLLRVLTAGNDGDFILPTFTSFLQKLSSANPPTIPFVTMIDVVVYDWGFFSFLLDFLNLLLNVVNVVLFFINGIISAVSYVVWFFQWLFLV